MINVGTSPVLSYYIVSTMVKPYWFLLTLAKENFVYQLMFWLLVWYSAVSHLIFTALHQCACMHRGWVEEEHWPQHIDDDAEVAGYNNGHFCIGPVVLEVFAALLVHEHQLTAGEVDDKKYKDDLAEDDKEAKRLVLQQPYALKPERGCLEYLRSSWPYIIFKWEE